jgi:hypothetical protein
MMTGGLVHFRDMDQFRAAAEGRDSIKQQTSASVQEAAPDSVKIQSAASASEGASPSETVPPTSSSPEARKPPFPPETRLASPPVDKSTPYRGYTYFVHENGVELMLQRGGTKYGRTKHFPNEEAVIAYVDALIFNRDH